MDFPNLQPAHQEKGETACFPVGWPSKGTCQGSGGGICFLSPWSSAQPEAPCEDLLHPGHPLWGHVCSRSRVPRRRGACCDRLDQPIQVGSHPFEQFPTYLL